MVISDETRAELAADLWSSIRPIVLEELSRVYAIGFEEGAQAMKAQIEYSIKFEMVEHLSPARIVLADPYVQLMIALARMSPMIADYVHGIPLPKMESKP